MNNYIKCVTIFFLKNKQHLKKKIVFSLVVINFKSIKQYTFFM